MGTTTGEGRKNFSMLANQEEFPYLPSREVEKKGKEPSTHGVGKGDF